MFLLEEEDEESRALILPKVSAAAYLTALVLNLNRTFPSSFQDLAIL